MINHRSIRKYLPKKVDLKLINQALEKAIRASSSGNMQTYSVIVTQEENLRKKLWKAHLEQDMVLEAPVFITFCGDNARHTTWTRQRGIEDFNNFDNFLGFMISAIDAILVAQNCALNLEETGLGICYLGSAFANAAKISKILKLPKRVIPIVGYTVGWPNENPPLKDRLPLNQLVHHETYQTLSKEKINRTYAEREKSGWDRYVQSEAQKKELSAKNIHNLAQLYARAKYTKAEYDDFSKDIIKFLKENNYLPK